MQPIEDRRVDLNRDMDLIRVILLRVEGDPKLDGTHWEPFDKPDEFPGYSLKEVQYHVDLLIESGLLRGNTKGDVPIVSQLTWNGHEFLDAIRNPEIWENVKSRLGGLGKVTLKLVMEIATAEIRKKLGL